MFFAFVSVYLLVCFNYVKFYEENLMVKPEPWHPITHDRYKDMDDNLLPNLNYCGNKTCLVKCCGDGQYLDFNYTCKDEEYFKQIYYDEPSLGENNWKEVTQKIKKKTDSINTTFTMLQRVENSIEPISNFNSITFYLLHFGSLYYTYDTHNGPWEELTELRYCVDHLFNAPNAKKKIDFVFEVVKEPQSRIDRRELNDKRNITLANIKILGAGLVITFISICCLLFRLQKVRRRYITYTLMAYLYTISFAYGLKLMELFGRYTEVIVECKYKYLSTPMYFVLLSAFCWPLALTYDLLTSIRKFRMKKDVKNQAYIVTFFRISVFSWGLPLLLTVMAVLLDKNDMSRLFTEKPLFDSCVDNDNQIFLYLYVPISILILLNSLLFLIYSYDMWIIKCVLRKNSYLANNKFTALRSLVCRKLIGIVMLMILLQFLPDVPILLSNILYVSSGITWIVLAFIFFYNKTVFVNLYNRFINKYNTEQFQKLEEETEHGKGNCGKISTISNNRLDQDNNTAYIKNNNLENNLAMFCNIDLEKDKDLDDVTKMIEKDPEKGEEESFISNNDFKK